MQEGFEHMAICVWTLITHGSDPWARYGSGGVSYYYGLKGAFGYFVVLVVLDYEGWVTYALSTVLPRLETPPSKILYPSNVICVTSALVFYIFLYKSYLA